MPFYQKCADSEASESLPEAEGELGEIGELLSGVLMEAGQSSGGDAGKIHRSAVGDQRPLSCETNKLRGRSKKDHRKL